VSCRIQAQETKRWPRLLLVSVDLDNRKKKRRTTSNPGNLVPVSARLAQAIELVPLPLGLPAMFAVPPDGSVKLLLLLMDTGPAVLSRECDARRKHRYRQKGADYHSRT
jgi:hypothetical protein